VAILAAALIDGAQALADRRSDASITSADWTRYVNDSVEELYRVLIGCDAGLYFQQSDFTLTGGAAGASFDLITLSAPTTAAKFRALHGLDLNPDTNFRRTIPRRNFRERNKGRIGWWLPALWDTDRRYDIRQTSLVITPYELAAGNYRVYWRQAPYKFSSSADTQPLDTVMEPYDEYVRVLAAMMAIGIEEGDQSPLATRLATLRNDIVESERRDDEPCVIADVEGTDSDSWGWP